MSMTDPIADMLTRIRNACGSKHRRVDMPLSKMKTEIARILKENDYIQDYATVETEDGKKLLRVRLKYAAGGQPVGLGMPAFGAAAWANEAAAACAAADGAAPESSRNEAFSGGGNAAVGEFGMATGSPYPGDAARRPIGGKDSSPMGIS